MHNRLFLIFSGILFCLGLYFGVFQALKCSVGESRLQTNHDPGQTSTVDSGIVDIGVSDSDGGVKDTPPVTKYIIIDFPDLGGERTPDMEFSEDYDPNDPKQGGYCGCEPACCGEFSYDHSSGCELCVN